MVIARTEGQTDIKAFDPILAQMPVFSGTPTGTLGFNYALALQIAGWVINGIGLGLSTYEAIKGAKTQSGVEKLEPGEISAIASQIAAADPQHRSAAAWETILAGQFGTTGTTPPVQIPPGFYIDPRTGQLAPLPDDKEAGMLGGLPTWSWIVIGLLGFMVLKGGGLKL